MQAVIEMMTQAGGKMANDGQKCIPLSCETYRGWVAQCSHTPEEVNQATAAWSNGFKAVYDRLAMMSLVADYGWTVEEVKAANPDFF